MDLELTSDPGVIIVHRQHNLVVYHNIEEDKDWLIAGKCDESGHCERKRTELDCPVTPELKCDCGLRGCWI